MTTTLQTLFFILDLAPQRILHVGNFSATRFRGSKEKRLGRYCKLVAWPCGAIILDSWIRPWSGLRRLPLSLHNDPFAVPGPGWHCHCDGSKRLGAK